MWADESVFYHIYPMGFCGAPGRNDFAAPPQNRLRKIALWLEHIESAGCNAVYLGPVFESTAHGYDTKDYFQIDRRLGSNDDFKMLTAQIHARGMKIVLDGVFNHVGRNFWAFEDVLKHKQNSPYCGWFFLNFGQNNGYDDGFCYEGWDGCDDIVKLNLKNPEVKQYLKSAVSMWIKEFDIDGLRLDTAHYLDRGFLRELHTMVRSLKENFWLMGEVVFGNYKRLMNNEMLDSVTNYELYKALYSGCNDRNLYETAHALSRQFRPEEGVYEGCRLYSFLDNHDVTRIASIVNNQALLKPLYGLLFTIPGIPSIYYGSEWGIGGRRENGDSEVRPCLELQADNDLSRHIAWWASFRRKSKILACGSYHELEVRSELLVFSRNWENEKVFLGVNIAPFEQEVYLEGENFVIPPYTISILKSS